MTGAQGNGQPYALKTIGPNGEVPICRMERAEDVVNFVQQLIDDDEARSFSRSKVAGLVDGNPPYSQGKLIRAGRADACNVNWGTARGYKEAAVGSYYDLSTQAPGRISITTSHGTAEQQVEYSRTMSQGADLILTENADDWDSEVQMHQDEMVLYGHGPFFFEDPFKVFPRAIEDGALLVPDRTPSNINRWEIAACLFDYYPPELYAFIKDEIAAQQVGWNIKHTQQVIEYAMDQKQPDNRTQNWEWYQNELKSNSFNYIGQVNICRVAHVFWREFDSRVTHAIVERSSGAPQGYKYLYLHVGRYKNFHEVIHPMYVDKGRAGLYHNVTGLGVKMFGPMEYENRLLGAQMDAAFAPKILFKPTTSEAQTKFQLTRLGQWGVLPPGTDVAQTPTGSGMQDGIAMFRLSNELMRSNLSQNRQPIQMDKPGNPDTAKEVMLKASQQGSLSLTVFSRYYNQLDALYKEMVRRMCDLNSTDPVAKRFQEWCEQHDVPRECFGRVESVAAVRVVGQGSPFMRDQALQTVLGTVMARLPENGQQNLLDDFIASHAGYSAVKRWNPKSQMSQMMSDQSERAQLQVVAMRNGLSAVVSPSQDALIFALTYLKAGTDALNSVKQGANPQTVLAFLNLCGPAIASQIKRMAGDKTRLAVVSELEKQFKKLASLTDKLKGMVQKQMQAMQAQQGKTQGAMSDAQIKQFKAASDARLKAQKAAHSMKLKELATRQNLALNDARTGSEIALNHFRALNQ